MKECPNCGSTNQIGYTGYWYCYACTWSSKKRKVKREVKITGECEKCGRFEVIRKRGKRVDTHGLVHDLPRNVVCPSCRMWGQIVDIEELKK